jgi:hypothetical protein
MFMICNVVMSCSTDNRYCLVRSHICMCDLLRVRHVSCEIHLAHWESRHGRGSSPRRALRALGSGGKCLVRGVRVAGRRGGGARSALARCARVTRERTVWRRAGGKPPALRLPRRIADLDCHRHDSHREVTPSDSANKRVPGQSNMFGAETPSSNALSIRSISLTPTPPRPLRA